MPFRGISMDDEGSIIYDGEKFVVNHPGKVPDNFDPGDKPVVGLLKTHPSHPQNRQRPLIPTVIYTAFDKHRANEHQRRVEEVSDTKKQEAKQPESPSSETSLSGFPQDMEYQPDINEAELFNLCDRLCEENPQAMTAMMNFIEGFDPEDEEQTIRHRLNNHLRIIGLNDVFGHGDWYSTPMDPPTLLASPSFQNDTIDMAFADGNIGILQSRKPGAEEEDESQSINLASLNHLRTYVAGWDENWATEADLSHFIINKFANTYGVEVPDDFAGLSVEEQVMTLLQFVHYYREAYYSKTWQYESPHPLSILQEDYHDLLPLLELLDPRPLTDPAVLLDAFSFESQADATDYLRPKVELIYSKLGYELPANWADVEDAVLLANLLHTGIEDMFIRHESDGAFLSDYDPAVIEFRNRYFDSGYSPLNEDFQRLSGTYQSPDYSLFAFVLSIVFEPVDWVLTGAEVVDAASKGDWGSALIDFLLSIAPFVSGRVDNAIRRIAGDVTDTTHQLWRLGARSIKDFYNDSSRGLGILADQQQTVTEEGLAIIRQHLDAPYLDDALNYQPNAEMMSRLQKSFDEGTPISGADLSFYLHEQAEFHIMRQVVDKNMTLREMTENYPLEVITFEPDMIRRNNLLGTPLSELPEDIRNVVSYKYAHERALDLYQVSRYSVYHPKVLYRNQEEFSNRYFEFWGIDKQG